MKLKLLFLFLLTSVMISCSDDDDKDKHDPVAQALIDDEILVDFLQSHYLTDDNKIDSIRNGETPLYTQVDIEDLVYNDINYKLYYYIEKQGVGINPSMNDSIQILYQGFTLDSIKFDQNLSYPSYKSWFHLPNLIAGWRYGIPKYKSGTKVIYPDESFGYENTGSGIIFMPSGLAYGENGSANIPSNAPIYFFIDLGNVIRADADNDGVINNDEDINKNGDATDDDTDGDLVANYLDIDDDGDGITTILEDVDGDGNPSNDDTDKDGIPNYLDEDDDNDGRKTSKEDNNFNFNWNDDDKDGDGIPDYLDPDN
ncbi:FKBP-type peptidyl-prolyl cis-trans isomerase [Namhaeicola litoreus]|uniref:peptidylprolyl isomerase n=1 Tax=Namhaeicola litoreus TaxID=1052145 RepID=A0ABW3Y383_9FLAO